MSNFKSLVATGIMALCGVNAMAQNAEAEQLGYKPQPYGFVQVQGGVGSTLTDVNMFKLMTPTYSVAVGGMFMPSLGARLHVNGYKSTGAFGKLTDGTNITELDSPLKYKYNYINTNVDLMLNVVNLFTKKDRNLFDLYIIGGVGLNYAWNNSEFENTVASNPIANDISNAWGDNQTPRTSLLGHNLRVGILADFNLHKNVSLGLEIDANSLDDRFNSKYANCDDWMITGQLSLTVKFGHKKAKKVEATPEPAPVPPTPVPVPVVVEEKKVEPAPTPAAVVKEEPLHEVVYYAIRESNTEKDATIEKVVEWCKKYPNKKVTVYGYADKGTGNAKLNKGYASSRAQAVAKLLQEHGVPASQLKVDSFGDSVQPFSENDKNRCVIMEGK